MAPSDQPPEDAELVVGDGVLLSQSGRGGFTLRAVTRDGLVELGSFPTIAKAWEAMDDFDDDAAGLASKPPHE